MLSSSSALIFFVVLFFLLWEKPLDKRWIRQRWKVSIFHNLYFSRVVTKGTIIVVINWYFVTKIIWINTFRNEPSPLNQRRALFKLWNSCCIHREQDFQLFWCLCYITALLRENSKEYEISPYTATVLFRSRKSTFP